MLAYYNNFLSNQEILHDKTSNKNYLLIQKNGSANLQKLAKTMPMRYVIYDEQFLSNSIESEIVVFVRPPIERFISGLLTQIDIYGMSKKKLLKIVNNEQFLMFYDRHTIPQFWFLLSLSNKKPIRFNIQPLSALNIVDTNINQPYEKNPKKCIHLTSDTIRRLDHFYTEDVVMYNQFLNSTTSIDKIVDKIKLEKKFVDDILQYKQILTYLF